MLPILFCIFIRPPYDLEDLITYADANYAGSAKEDVTRAISDVKSRMERISKLMSRSRLKINALYLSS